MTQSAIPFGCFDSALAMIIRVMVTHMKFPLSLRNAEELLPIVSDRCTSSAQSERRGRMAGTFPVRIPEPLFICPGDIPLVAPVTETA